MAKQYVAPEIEVVEVDANDDFILTDKAPADAIADYNKHKQEYIKKVNGMSNEEYIEYLMKEDNEWLTFPIE